MTESLELRFERSFEKNLEKLAEEKTDPVCHYEWTKCEVHETELLEDNLRACQRIFHKYKPYSEYTYGIASPGGYYMLCVKVSYPLNVHHQIANFQPSSSIKQGDIA